ncbi:hypothetical protein [uncultured phage MedDCM-OCT-S04-C348]|nr:hypothetical protein [uncultured phage MedDCM-OCT-S04-C348]
MHQGKAKLYKMLTDAGLSDDDIYRGAQTAGITNLNSTSDAEQVIKAFENNFYEGTVTEGGGLKSEKDLFKEFKELGGKGKLQEFKDAQKYKSYNSEKDAQKFADYLSGQLTSQGIYQGQSGFDKAQDVFGKKFSMSEYDAALGYKNQDAKYIAKYLKDYIKKGGKVGDKVLALLEPEYKKLPIDAQAQNVMGPLTPLQAQFQTTFPMVEENMGPLQYSFG